MKHLNWMLIIYKFSTKISQFQKIKEQRIPKPLRTLKKQRKAKTVQKKNQKKLKKRK